MTTSTAQSVIQPPQQRTTGVIPTLVDAGSRDLIAALARRYRLPQFFAADLVSMFYLPRFTLSPNIDETYEMLIQSFPVFVFKWFTAYSLYRTEFLLDILLRSLIKQAQQPGYKGLQSLAQKGGKGLDQAMANAMNEAMPAVQQEATQRNTSDGWGNDPSALSISHFPSEEIIRDFHEAVKRVNVGTKIQDFIKFTLHNSIRSHLRSNTYETSSLLEADGEVGDLLSPEMMLFELWPLVDVSVPAAAMGVDLYIDYSGSMGAGLRDNQGDAIRWKSCPDEITRRDFAAIVAAHLIDIGMSVNLFIFNTDLFQHCVFDPRVMNVNSGCYLPPYLRMQQRLTHRKDGRVFAELMPLHLLHIDPTGGTDYGPIFHSVRETGRSSVVITDGEGDMGVFDERITWIRISDALSCEYHSSRGTQKYIEENQLLNVSSSELATLLR